MYFFLGQIALVNPAFDYLCINAGFKNGTRPTTQGQVKRNPTYIFCLPKFHLSFKIHLCDLTFSVSSRKSFNPISHEHIQARNSLLPDILFISIRNEGLLI